MEEPIKYGFIKSTADYALCKVINSRSRHYNKYVVLKCTLKRVNHWDPISNYYRERYTADSIYRRLIDGSKNL